MEQLKIKVKLDSGAYMPEKAYDTDAGFDIRTPERVFVSPCCPAVVYTGVHIETPKGYTWFVKSKSGLMKNCGIRCEGVIDASYRGAIMIKLYKDEDADELDDANFFEVGDKIAQICLLPVPDVELVEAEELSPGARGDNGFGSSGR